MPASLASIIDLFNTRYNNYRREQALAVEVGDEEAQEVIKIKLAELTWCIQEAQAEYNKEAGKYPPTTLDTLCAFKKYKAANLTWKEIIEDDPGYVDFCLSKVAGFELDETAMNYLIEIQESQSLKNEDYYDRDR